MSLLVQNMRMRQLQPMGLFEGHGMGLNVSVDVTHGAVMGMTRYQVGNNNVYC